jgi:hypothetical protein
MQMACRRNERNQAVNYDQVAGVKDGMTDEVMGKDIILKT